MTGLGGKIIRYLLGLFIVVVWTGGVTVCPGAGEIYFWTDRQGVKHYSNVAPSTSGITVEQLQEDGARYQGLPSGTRDGIPFNAVKIYDGDSLKVSGAGLTIMVRLVGIDAPETGGKKHLPQPFSRKAKDAFSRMIAHTPFTLKSYGTGGYNRVLAELFVGGQNINLELLRQGLAEVYQGKIQAGLDKKAYLGAQEQAKKRRRGIWSLGNNYESPRLWRKNHPRN